MAKQKGLGKGLGALLGEESLRADTPAEGAVSTLPLQKIEPNPLQPRKTFAEEELDALAESIDRKSTRLNSSHRSQSRMPSSA